MRLNVLKCVLHNIVLGNQIFELPTVGILLNALCNDTETVEVDLLILCVLKVISNTAACAATHVNHSYIVWWFDYKGWQFGLMVTRWPRST